MVGRWRAALALFGMLVLGPTGVGAHHILGVPHYSYDEQYPQAPVLTYLVATGPYEVRMTGYPGRPSPGERCSFNIYIRRAGDASPFDGQVTMRVLRDRLIGRDPVVYGPVEAALEEAVYKFYPRFDEVSNYIVRVEFEADGAPWTIDLPIVVGEPGSPWTVLGGVVAGLALFLIMVRAIRIKLRRREVESEKQ